MANWCSWQSMKTQWSWRCIWTDNATQTPADKMRMEQCKRQCQRCFFFAGKIFVQRIGKRVTFCKWQDAELHKRVTFSLPGGLFQWGVAKKNLFQKHVSCFGHRVQRQEGAVFVPGQVQDFVEDNCHQNTGCPQRQRIILWCLDPFQLLFLEILLPLQSQSRCVTTDSHADVQTAAFSQHVVYFFPIWRFFSFLFASVKFFFLWSQMIDPTTTKNQCVKASFYASQNDRQLLTWRIFYIATNKQC